MLIMKEMHKICYILLWNCFIRRFWLFPVFHSCQVNKTNISDKILEKYKFAFKMVSTRHRSLKIVVFKALYFQLNIESMARYVSPVNPAIFSTLTLVLLGIGLFFTAWFFVYEVTSTKFTREMPKELLISFVASVFMGLGTHFLILWVGIFV